VPTVASRPTRAILEQQRCLYRPPTRGRRVRNLAGVDQALSCLAERARPHPRWAAASIFALLRAGQGNTQTPPRLTGDLPRRRTRSSPARWPPRSDRDDRRGAILQKGTNPVIDGAMGQTIRENGCRQRGDSREWGTE